MIWLGSARANCVRQFVRDVQAASVSPGASTRHRHWSSCLDGRDDLKCADVRIESVTAVAFGPFRNVTLGVRASAHRDLWTQRAGKSSWHAAITPRFADAPRARQPRLEDRDFADRRPWDGNGWEVRAIVR